MPVLQNSAHKPLLQPTGTNQVGQPKQIVYTRTFIRRRALGQVVFSVLWRTVQLDPLENRQPGSVTLARTCSLFYIKVMEKVLYERFVPQRHRAHLLQLHAERILDGNGNRVIETESPTLVL